MGAEIKITNNSREIQGIFDTQAYKALIECGLVAEGYAKGLCPVDTGNLRNSITHKVVGEFGGNACYIGSNTEYAPYVEYGTGTYYAGGRKTPWSYQDSNGQWHRTNGQKAQPFIRPAVADHTSEYKRIIEAELKR